MGIIGSFPVGFYLMIAMNQKITHTCYLTPSLLGSLFLSLINQYFIAFCTFASKG